MGLIAEKSKNISLKNFNITLRPGSKRMMSSAADATHFVGCQGSIRIENCLFENMHDDGVNIHGVYVLLHGLVDKNTLGIQLNHAQQWGFDFAAIGDSVTLVDRATMEGYAKLVVKEIKNINEEYIHLIFDRDISTIIKPNTSIENTTLYPDKMFIKGCTIRNNRARGILISSRGKIEILNNYFSNEMAGIFISGDANFWWESGPVNNVLIKNNKFYNCCISKLDQAPILIDPIILKPELSKTHFEKNIVIDSNIFETFDQPILKAKSTNGLKFTNNTIIQTKTFKPLYPASPAISVVYSTNVVIKNNQYKGDSAPVLHLDKASFEKGIMKNNKGFKVGK